MVYRYLADLPHTDAAGRAASLVVRFEQLCDDPATTLRAVMNHYALTNTEPILEKYAANICRPDYYQTSFSSAELATNIGNYVIASRWGYEMSGSSRGFDAALIPSFFPQQVRTRTERNSSY